MRQGSTLWSRPLTWLRKHTNSYRHATVTLPSRYRHATITASSNAACDIYDVLPERSDVVCDMEIAWHELSRNCIALTSSYLTVEVRVKKNNKKREREKEDNSPQDLEAIWSRTLTHELVKSIFQFQVLIWSKTIPPQKLQNSISR